MINLLENGLHKNFLYLCLIIACLNSSNCISFENTYTGLAPGMWRAVLKLDKPHSTAVEDLEIEKRTDYRELPFNFEVQYLNQDSFTITIHNGAERIVIDDIYYGRDIKEGKDTIQINFPVYDTYITAIYEENIMEGAWHVNYKDDYSIPFIAFHGQDHRFKNSEAVSDKDLSGKWRCEFDFDKVEDAYPAIGEFTMDGNNLGGTFRTETGDYRFLEGTVKNDKFYLSCFDGSHAFLFEGKLMSEQKLLGTFYSGSHYQSNFTAEKDDSFTLESTYNLTKVEDENSFYFEFPSTSGEMISLDSEPYKKKKKLVQIIGTWCPNCRDETKFLVDYHKTKKEDDIEIIAIAFERYRDDEKSMEAIRRYTEKMQIPYPVLLGGYYDKKEASKKFPSLNKIISYPTLLFIDEKNKIQKIHTGFNGPATSKYQEFITEFNDIIKEL